MAEPTTDAAFAAWLRRELDERGWRAEDLAWRAGVVPGTVEAWLAGLRQPEPYARDAVAAALGHAPGALPPRPPRRRKETSP